MKNLIIERVVKVKLHITAEQWQLYDSKSGQAYGMAQILNKNIEEYVNRGEDRATTTRITQSLMRHASDLGANDTEPRDMLEQILNEIYGES